MSFSLPKPFQRPQRPANAFPDPFLNATSCLPLTGDTQISEGSGRCRAACGTANDIDCMQCNRHIAFASRVAGRNFFSHAAPPVYFARSGLMAVAVIDQITASVPPVKISPSARS